MRPRKRVLLVGLDDYDLSPLRFLLETVGYRALSAETREVALAAAAVAEAEVGVSCAIVLLPFHGDKELAWALRQINPTIVIVFMHAAIHAAPIDVKLAADANIPRNTPHKELIQRLKIWTQARRGPKSARPVERVAVEVGA